MIKKITFLTGLMMVVMLLLAANLFATDYEVSGAGSSEVNGVYVENGTNGGKPKYEFTNGGTTYYLGFDDASSSWLIGTSLSLYPMMSHYYINSSSDTPPSSGWGIGYEGSSPAPTVSEAGPNLSRNSDTFYESADNDGSIDNTITITYNFPEGDSFSGSNGTFSTDNYTTSNVPAGLSVSITKNSDTELSVTLTGNATSHVYTDDIANLEIALLDAAFANGDASAVNNTTQSNIVVDYGLPITSLADLRTLSETPANWDKYIIQTTDIDASATSGWNVGDHDGDGTTPEEAMGFYPIGRDNGTTFTGYYNGGGYSITNLYINRVDTETATDAGRDIGLFGYSKGKIENLGVVNANITGHFSVGALVGTNLTGGVRNCYSSGNVNSNDQVGGLIGANNTNVQNSYSTADVLCTYEDFHTIPVGGFVGYAKGSSHISNCYSTGDVTKEKAGDVESYGAFCGQNKATIENCYSTGNVFYNQGDNPSDKGFVGEGSQGVTYNNNFFDSDESNQSSATGATEKNTTEMQLIETYTDENTTGLTSAWDFDGTENDDSGTQDYWGINYNGQNNGYPFLSWQDYDHVVSQPGLWTGAEDSDWHNSNNWDDSQVPGATVDVTIPDTGNDPVISAAATCQNITIQENSLLTINSSHTLDVTGDFTLEAGGDFTNSGTLKFSGTGCELKDNRTTKSSLGNILVDDTAL
jgi:hypothetical protein